MVKANGAHGLCCSLGPGRVARHASLNDLIAGALFGQVFQQSKNLRASAGPMGRDRMVSRSVFELPGGLGGLNPLPHLADPPTSRQISTPGGRVSTPHLRFAEVGMLFLSHFLLMQFLKYLQCDDLNVTTILIHIED